MVEVCMHIMTLTHTRQVPKFYKLCKEDLAIRRIFSLVDIITNTKFSNCTNVFEIGVV